MNLIRQFLAVLRMSRALKYTPEADLPEFWTKEDSLWLDSQLKTYPGQKLKLRLDNYVLNAARMAIIQKTHRQYEYDSGEANGIRLGVEAIYSHLPIISPAPAHDASETQQQEDTLPNLEPIVS